MITCLQFLASELTITFNGSNPFVGETGRNIRMQWNINWTNKPVKRTIEYINLYVQDQSNDRKQVTYWVDSKPHVFQHGKDIYGDRLIPNFTDNKFLLTIHNVKYEDSRNYSVRVSLFPDGRKDVNVILYVHGMFFLMIHVLGRSSENHSNLYK